MKIMDFLKEYEFSVQVFDDDIGELGPAKLFFGPERWAHIDFGFGARPKMNVLPKGKLLHPLKAISTDGTQFTLFDCKRFDHTMGIGYVITGHTDGQFKKIIVRYSDISEWLLPWGPTDNAFGENITWREPKHISANVQIEKAQLLLSTISDMSVKHQGEDHIFHQHVLFCLEHITGHFSPSNAREKVLELSNLLSILIGHPLSIINVEVTAENGSTHELFFPTFKPILRDSPSNGFWIRCLTQYGKIYDQWETIFNGYFNSTYRNALWARFAGMQRYEGFREYRTLGYVALLDKYITQRTKNLPKIKIPANTGAVRQLENLLKKISPSLLPGQQQAALCAVKNAFSKEVEPSFSHKYRQVLSESNPHVVKVINISDVDFKLIKDVRDKIAHGDSVDVPEGNFTPIVTVVNKIILLLTYWAFLDVGLNDSDFLDCLDYTRSPLKSMADLNRIHLDRVIRPNHFLSVTNAEFEKIAKIKNIKMSACFLRVKSGAVRYSKKYSDKNTEWRFRKNVKSGVTPHSKIFGVSENRITYLSPIYIECGEKILDIAYGFVIQSE